jgi:hypothetical protein
MVGKGAHIDIRLGQAAGREGAAFASDDAGHAGVRNKWFVVGMALIFLGMLVVMLYATGVYQQGIQPYLAPILAKAKQAWEERQAKPATPQVALSQPHAAPAPTQQPGLAEPASLQQSGSAPEDQPSATPPEKESTHLVRVYERMRPKDAAPIVEQLEISLAVEILSRMPDRQAARILGAMAPERAARITAKLAERSQ